MELCSKCNQQRMRNNIAVGSGKYTTQLRRTSRGRTSVRVLGASSEEISGSNLRHAQPFPHSSQIIWIASIHYLPSLLLHIALKKHVSLAMVYKKQPLLLLRNFASSQGPFSSALVQSKKQACSLLSLYNGESRILLVRTPALVQTTLCDPVGDCCRTTGNSLQHSPGIRRCSSPKDQPLAPAVPDANLGLLWLPSQTPFRVSGGGRYQPLK